MNPISLMHLHRLLLPCPRSHWSATRPRSKTQPTTTRHTQRKHTRHNCWHLKPVRSVSETGQTASAGLSLSDVDIQRVTQVDEDNTPININQGPITRSRAKKLQQEVNSLLAEINFNISENVILPKCSTLVVLRYI
jgi:hypothetical protein